MVREHRTILVTKGLGIPPCDAAVNQYPGRVASPFFDFVIGSHCPGKHLRSLQRFLIGSENRGVGRHWPTLYAHLRVVAYSAGGDEFTPVATPASTLLNPPPTSPAQSCSTPAG